MNHTIANLTNETISITLRLEDPVSVNYCVMLLSQACYSVLQDSQTLSCVVWNDEVGGI